MVVAVIYNSYVDKFGIPRQSGLVDNLSTVVLNKEFGEDAVRELDSFSHLWLLWQSNETSLSQTVRPPRLGGNKRVGVFASRSPFRPTPIGLSCVELKEIKKTSKGISLIVSGADVLNGTPILDIKPYVPYCDAHPDARAGFSVSAEEYHLDIENPEALDSVCEKDDILKILAHDPRPAYHESGRIYRLDYGNANVSFSVRENKVKIETAEEKQKSE